MANKYLRNRTPAELMDDLLREFAQIEAHAANDSGVLARDPSGGAQSVAEPARSEDETRRRRLWRWRRRSGSADGLRQ